METFAICSLALLDATAGAVVWLAIGPTPGAGRALGLLSLLPIGTLLVIAVMVVRRRRRDRANGRSELDQLDAIIDDSDRGRW